MSKILSIIIPTYNAEKFLNKGLSSFLVCRDTDAQTAQHNCKMATEGRFEEIDIDKAILDKLGETERTMAVSGMYGKVSAINGNVLEVAFESEIIYRMMSAPGALEKVNGAADKVAPGYTVRMTHSSGGDDIESTGRALFGSNFRIEN